MNIIDYWDHGYGFRKVNHAVMMEGRRREPLAMALLSVWLTIRHETQHTLLRQFLFEGWGENANGHLIVEVWRIDDKYCLFVYWPHDVERRVNVNGVYLNVPSGSLIDLIERTLTAIRVARRDSDLGVRPSLN